MSGFSLLLDSALKGAVLVGIAAAAAWTLRRRSAASRHAVWSAAVVAHLALPILALLVPAWRLPLLPPAPWSNSASIGRIKQVSTPSSEAAVPNGPRNAPPNAPLSAPAEARQGTSGPQPVGAGTASLQGASDSHPTSPQPPPNAVQIVAALWLLGTLLVLARLVVGTWRVSRLARTGERVDDGEWLSLTQRLANQLRIARPLTLLRGNRLGIPVTWGVVYPAVLLPPDADEWSEEQRRFVLVHEMAHVKRFDALTQLLAQCAIALFWFDPLLWIAARRMRVEREHACDDFVLREGTTPSLYAGELLAMVQRLGTPSHERTAPAFAALAMARRSEFEGRMLAILDPRLDRQTFEGRGTLVTAIVVLVLALPLAALRPFAEGTATAPNAVARVVAPVPVAPNVARKAPSPVLSGCDHGNPGNETSTHISTDGDGGARMLEYFVVTPGRCAEATVFGLVRFTDDETDIASLGAGSFATFRERGAAGDRRVTVTPGANGVPQYAITRDGHSVPWDAAAHAWLSKMLPEVLRELAVNVPARVARLREQGGVPAVLNAIGRMRSENAKRAHYEALAELRLQPDEAERAVRQAGRDLASNASDLAVAVSRLQVQLDKTPTAQQALGEAVGQIMSSGDKAQVLNRMVHTADRGLLLQLAKEAEGTSSGDRSQFLRNAASPYLNPNDRGLRDAYFAVASTIPSSSDLGMVLTGALPYGHGAPEVTLAVLATALRMTSTSDRANVLVTAATQRLITTPAAREAYLRTARTLGSSDDYRRAMEAFVTP